MVESGNFSLRSQGLNFLTSNIRDFNLFWCLFNNCTVCFVQEAER